MSENSERLPNEVTNAESSADRLTNGETTQAEKRSSSDSAETDEARSVREYIESLKQGLDKTRLSPELKEWYLAEMPTPEEAERLYREVIEHGGYSSEEMEEMISEIESQL